MVHHSSVCPAADSAIQGPYGTAFHLFSILILWLIPGLSRAQTGTASWEPVSIERREVLSGYFSEEIIRKTSLYKIIHFGDSHIQGDLITGEIRKALQGESASGGSGLIFPMALCGSFGPAGVKSRLNGKYSWSTFLKNPEKRPIGISGYELTAEKNSTLSLEFNENFKGKLQKDFSVWIFSSEDSIHLDAGLPVMAARREKVSGNLYTYRFSCDSIPCNLSISFRRTCSFWGLEFHPPQGLIYQQSGLVGAQFLHLASHSNHFSDQLIQLKPDLLIFSYGSNEAYEVLDSSRYREKITSLLKEIRLRIPKAGLLLTNAPDTRSGGRIPISQRQVNTLLSEVAAELNLPFFDWNRSMGGWGSLYRWDKNQLFLSDLLHFSRKGALLTGELFSCAFLEAGNFREDKVGELRQALSARMRVVLSAEGKALPETAPPAKNEGKEKGRDSKITKAHNKLVLNSPQLDFTVYEVKQGDNLSLIARRTRTGITDLIRLNKLESPDKLQIGQKIRIR